MKEKSIPAFITLCAGAIASIACIIYEDSLLTTLKTVFIVILIFYVVGVIIGRIIAKINKSANDAYVLKERERMKAEKEAAQAAENEPTLNEEPVTGTEDGQENNN